LVGSSGRSVQCQNRVRLKANNNTVTKEAFVNLITGRSAFLALLKDEGITHLFGNPGTTELPVMHALKDHPELTYVMAMQESLVVAIADGYSRASGRLVACNVHVAPGLGNAMGSLYNAQFTGTPMILTAGQQEQGHGLMEPLLYGPLVRMAEPLVKWAVEVTRICRASSAAPPRSQRRRRPDRYSYRCRATSSIPKPASSLGVRPASTRA